MNSKRRRRTGKTLVVVAIVLPTLLSLAALVIDTGCMLAARRELQHAVDAAATAAAMDLLLEKEAQVATTAATYIQQLNGLDTAVVSVNSPPTSGPYQGLTDHLEVAVTQELEVGFARIFGVTSAQQLAARAVAGHRASTSGVAVVVLDTNPSEISIAPVPGVFAGGPALLGGLEVLGVGTVAVDGAVLVNTPWGGVDEDNNPAGESEGPPYGIACTPVLPLTRLHARDIRVSGGVDDPANYGHFETGEPSPLEANRLPVPDPYASLPPPTLASDPFNVSSVNHGAVSIASLPLDPPVELAPGVYDYIEITSGIVNFQPGVYIIRNVHPDTGIALKIAGGVVVADGVMFYITNSASYDPATGLPDADDGETPPPQADPTPMTPSAAINAGLVACHFAGLDDPASPFHGMFLYQRRRDRRPIVLVHESIIGAGQFAGTLYAKWGHVTLKGSSRYDARIVAGTTRLQATLEMTIEPSVLLPPARDVFLRE